MLRGNDWSRAHGDIYKADDMGTPWSEKIWLGKSEISDEHLCGCSDGVAKPPAALVA